MTKRILVAAALAGLASVVLPSSSKAACCVAYDYNDAHKNTNQIISQLTERINAMQLAIIEAMRLGTGQLSGNLKEQIGANSNVANVQDDRAVTGRVEQARLAAIKGAASGASSCNVITGARNGGQLSNAAAAFRKSLSSDTVNWDLGAVDALPSAQGSDLAVRARLKRHCSLYANQDDVRSGLCEAAASGDLQNASVDVSKSLFYQADGSSSVTLDQQRLDAAKTFMLTAIAPRPLGGMLPKEAQTPGGQEKASNRQAAAARTSIAVDTVNDILARRAPTGNGAVLQWAQSTASQISGYQANFQNGISWMDWMDVRAKGWYLNPNWGVATDTQGYEQTIKDIAMINAFQAYLGWEQYQQTQRTNLILATILAIQSENSRNPAQISGSR